MQCNATDDNDSSQFPVQYHRISDTIKSRTGKVKVPPNTYRAQQLVQHLTLLMHLICMQMAMNCVNTPMTHTLLFLLSTLAPALPSFTILRTAHKNNLKLNLAKSKEIIFVDKRRKADFSVPAIMPELQRVQLSTSSQNSWHHSH